MSNLDLTNRNSVAQAAQKKNVPAKPFSQVIREKMATTLTGKKLDTFVSDVVALTSNNPAIAKCEPISIIGACLQAQTLGLSLNQAMGQAWIIPFKDNKLGITRATFQIGYRGFINLAIRTGEYVRLNVLEIKEGELKSWNPLTEDIEVELVEDGMEREKLPTIGYYAMFEYRNGFRKAMYWNRSKMESHARKYSQPYKSDLKYGKQSSIWSTDFDSMAKKTMLRQLISHWGAMNTDMITAITTDGAVAVDIGKFEYQDALDVEASPVEPQAAIEQKKRGRPRKEETVNVETGEVAQPEPSSLLESVTVGEWEGADEPTPEEIAEMERREVERQRDLSFYGD